MQSPRDEAREKSFPGRVAERSRVIAAASLGSRGPSDRTARPAWRAAARSSVLGSGHRQWETPVSYHQEWALGSSGAHGWRHQVGGFLVSGAARWPQPLMVRNGSRRATPARHLGILHRLHDGRDVLVGVGGLFLKTIVVLRQHVAAQPDLGRLRIDRRHHARAREGVVVERLVGVARLAARQRPPGARTAISPRKSRLPKAKLAALCMASRYLAASAACGPRVGTA